MSTQKTWFGMRRKSIFGEVNTLVIAFEVVLEGRNADDNRLVEHELLYEAPEQIASRV